MTTVESYHLTQPIGEGDHVRGPSSAEVSLVEYGSFECPYCRSAEAIVAGLFDALGDNLRVAYRHFPMDDVHPHARQAAEASEAAAEQGKFWEMYDKLLANQDALDEDSLVQYAAELSLDTSRYHEALRNHTYRERVTEDREGGLQSHVNGTPTFYIDGVRYNGPIALRELLSAIIELHPDLGVAVPLTAQPRIPRVVWRDTGATTAPEANKSLVRAAFDAWARGEGNVYSLLADDAVWTITGSSPLAGTYSGRQDFLDRAIQPIFQRLSEPIRPVVKALVAEGDQVVVLWDGHATALDGVPYDNTYCWILRVENGAVKEATAFFDAPPLTDLLTRIQT